MNYLCCVDIKVYIKVKDRIAPLQELLREAGDVDWHAAQVYIGIKGGHLLTVDQFVSYATKNHIITQEAIKKVIQELDMATEKIYFLEISKN